MMSASNNLVDINSAVFHLQEVMINVASTIEVTCTARDG
jgi:hypothetical protein